jgi:predicted nucleic acid-binding protein
MRTRRTRTEPPSPPTQTLPSTLYLDTQFLFAYLVADDADHEAAAIIGRRLEALVEGGFARAYLSITVLDELAWKLSGVVYDDENDAAGAWRQLSQPEQRRAYRVHATTVGVLLLLLLEQPWISVLPVDEEVCDRLPLTLTEHRLPPADACHLTCAARHRVRGILTNDRRFAELTDSPVEIVTYGPRRTTESR